MQLLRSGYSDLNTYRVKGLYSSPKPFKPALRAHPYSYVLLTTHPLLVPPSWKSRAIPLPTLWATPGLKRDHFTFLYLFTSQRNYAFII